MECSCLGARVRPDTGVDIIRHSVGLVLQALIEAEVTDWAVSSGQRNKLTQFLHWLKEP